MIINIIWLRFACHILNMSSQSSDLSENELLKMEKSAKAKNTMKNTDWGVNKFKNWLTKRSITCVLSTIEATDLCEILRKFYAEVKASEKAKKKALSPSTLTCIRAAIRRYIIEDLHRPMDIIADNVFRIANLMFASRCKLYVAAGNPKPKHKPVIEDGDMQKLAVYFLDYKKNPVVLTEAVWFYLCFFFGRRGREGWADLKQTAFKIEKDSKGQQYICMEASEITKNHRDADYSDQRIYGKGVEMFKFLQSKLNPDCDRLFQYPLISYRSDSLWYKRAPIGKNTLATLMKTISKNAGLSQVYTNHSVRATTITALHRGGVDTSSIIAVTNHKNINSLSHYIDGLSEAEKQHCSGVLAHTLASTSTATADIIDQQNDENDSVNKEKVKVTLLSIHCINYFFQFMDLVDSRFHI